MESAVDILAAKIHEFCASKQVERTTKDKSNDSSRVSCKFEELFEESKQHYRDCAQFVLDLLK